jgi:hypothetical protein
MAVFAVAGLPHEAVGQTAWDPNAIVYDGPTVWQQAAVAALNRHLPTDSGYFVLGPLDLGADLPDTTDLVRTTLRILAPDPRSSRIVTRRLWVPTGGVALEELQPSDTLPHELPPGYPGRFLKGTIVGEETLVQVFTIQEHRWLLWAQRTQVDEISEQVSGPIADYSRAVTRYLAAVDSGVSTSGPPLAADRGLQPLFDLYAQPPEPVIRDRQGYLNLLDRNRAFSLDGEIKDVVGFIPGPRLMAWLEEQADAVLFPHRDGELALQHRYRDFMATRSRWNGRPILDASTLPRLRAGRYQFVVDRYGFLRVGLAGNEAGDGAAVTQGMLAHGDPVRVAGEMVIRADPGEPIQVKELSVRSEDYFFSNLSITLYPDIEERSDRYVAELGHALRALDRGRIGRDQVLIRKF